MFPFAILFFVLSANVIAADFIDILIHSYRNLKPLNYICKIEDLCAERETQHSLNFTNSTTCSCHAECSSFGTCCFDSPHRVKSPSNHKCVQVGFPVDHFGSDGFYMVQSCPEKSIWKELCEGDLDKDGDFKKIAPVTSLDTKTTYKNYHCFRCYESTDNFLYWDLKILSDYYDLKTGDFKVTYNDVNHTWFAANLDKDISVTVSLQFVIPRKIKFTGLGCNLEIITDCPDSWKDDDIRNKCHSYMDVLYSRIGWVYKNVHCLLCNFEALQDISCEPRIPEDELDVEEEYTKDDVRPNAEPIPGPRRSRPKIFLFSHIIDLNRLDINKADKKEKCAEGEVMDPYRKKCIKLHCALPGYVIKDGKCVPP